MTTPVEPENRTPLFREAPQAAWREILRQRWSRRSDEALVLLDRTGLHQVMWPRRYSSAQPAGAGRAREAEGHADPVLLGGYTAAYRVRLAESRAARPVRLTPTYGPPESVSVHVHWWVHDPALVVRAQVEHGWAVVSQSLAHRLQELESELAAAARPMDAAEVLRHMSRPKHLSDCGLTYRVADVRTREPDGELLLAPSGGRGFPSAWTPSRRQEYDFCLYAIRNGPVSLVALWLLSQPEQVREVLEWTVSNQALIREETTWQDEIAGLLGALSEEERRELSKLLRDRLLRIGRGTPPHEDEAADSWETSAR
ncbi:hypothetical protein ACTWP5_25600 [Streptomyces sp. 4N509B]|uniref:hypothetical protein n=1 Tax=Streptomyces sp. 4N509B TaxID=3457413 RepID=UPI003FCF47E7